VGDQGGVFPLAIGAKGALEEEQVGKEWVASGFLVQGLLFVEGQGPFAGQEEGTVFFVEEVVEFGAQTKIDGGGGGQGTDVDGEKRGVFGLPFDVNEMAVSKFFEHAFESGDGDVGLTGKIFVGATGG
jgi:hypothetical protein